MKVELWANDCYSCDKDGKYDPLRRWILDNGVSLGDFVVKRLITNQKWLDEAESYGVEIPAVKIIYDNGEDVVMDYEHFKETMIESVQVVKMKKKRTKKTAIVKSEEVKTTSED